MPSKPLDDNFPFHVGAALRSWAGLEMILFAELGMFLGVDQFRARIVWKALPNFRVRRELLVSLSETYLDTEQLPEYRRLLKRCKRLSAFRNDLAHNLFYIEEKTGLYCFMNDAAKSEIGAYFSKIDKFQIENIKNLAKNIDALIDDFQGFREKAIVYTSARMHREPHNDPTYRIGPRPQSTPQSREDPPQSSQE